MTRPAPSDHGHGAAVLEFRAFDMGIFAVETRHPFVVREAHGRKLVRRRASVVLPTPR